MKGDDNIASENDGLILRYCNKHVKAETKRNWHGSAVVSKGPKMQCRAHMLAGDRTEFWKLAMSTPLPRQMWLLNCTSLLCLL